MFLKKYAAFFLILLIMLCPIINVFAIADTEDPEHIHVPTRAPVWKWAEDYSACTAYP